MEISKIDYTKQQFTETNFKRFEFTLFNKKGYIKKLTFLSGLVPKVIQKIFGNSNFKFKGEFINDTWIVEFKGSIFAIVSAPGRGTTLETTATDEKILTEFVDEAVNEFLKLDDPKIEILKTFLT